MLACRKPYHVGAFSRQRRTGISEVVRRIFLFSPNGILRDPLALIWEEKRVRGGVG